MEKLVNRVRGVLLDIMTDTGLFALAIFLYTTFSGAAYWTQFGDSYFLVLRYLLIPWGAMLLVTRFQRAQQKRLFSADTVVLGLLVVWMIVPFGLRFGITYSNLSNWFCYPVVFFGIYAKLKEEEPERRAQELDRLCAFSAAVSFVLGVALLYTVVTVQAFGKAYGGFAFGVESNGVLCAGVNPNPTAMMAAALAMLGLTGAVRRRHPLAKAAHLIPAVMMALVVVFTQSRTSRLALLLGLAVSAYGALCTGLKGRAAVRHGAGIACALAVLVLGYAGADALTRAAVAHYRGEPVLVASAVAEEAQPEKTPVPAAANAKVRQGYDNTFSMRTLRWKQLFAFWRENPKYLLIGNGVGRSGGIVVLEAFDGGADWAFVHNAFLEFIADFGLIGFAILLAFFVLILRPVLRAFYARGDAHETGMHVLAGLAVAMLVTGAMESFLLQTFTPANTMFFLTLGILTAAGQRAAR